jgi:hypothetical protein
MKLFTKLRPLGLFPAQGKPLEGGAPELDRQWEVTQNRVCLPSLRRVEDMVGKVNMHLRDKKSPELMKIIN